MQSPGDHSEQAPPDLDQTRSIAGFWRRLLAFIVDWLILGAGGYVSGLFLFEFYVHLGLWGRLFGFAVALAYFGIFNSSAGGGRTVGKRIFRIEVVDKEGSHISILRSMIRYSVLGVPFSLNLLLMPARVGQSLFGYLMGILVLTLLGAIVYLYIFNRRSRQSLHDLVAGTYVVRRHPEGPVAAPPLWKPHLIVLTTWLAVVSAYMVFLAPMFLGGAFLAEIVPVQRTIESLEDVHVAAVMVGKRTAMPPGGTRVTSYVEATVTLKQRPEDRDKAAMRVAAVVLETYARIAQMDFLAVTVRYGFDIGIASSWRGQTVQFSLEEWRYILQPDQEAG